MDQNCHLQYLDTTKFIYIPKLNAITYAVKQLTRRFNCSISASSCLIQVSDICSLLKAPVNEVSKDFSYHHCFRISDQRILHKNLVVSNSKKSMTTMQEKHDMIRLKSVPFHV